MNMIVAVDKNWAIGNNGQLLVSIPEDQKLFRQETMGKVVVMGKKTLKSLPGGSPLYGRTNIVLSSDPACQIRGAKVCHSLDEALEILKSYPTEDIFICGGQKVYEMFLPFCDTAHVTYIDYEYQADAYFPNIDRDGGWKLVSESEEHTYFDICYEFRLYRRQGKADRER